MHISRVALIYVVAGAMAGAAFAQEAITTTPVLEFAVFACSATNSVDQLRAKLSVDDAVTHLRERGDIASLVKKLVESGDVCAVVGHKWVSVPHVTLEYRPDGDYPVHRKCVLCGKVETKEPGAWK